MSPSPKPHDVRFFATPDELRDWFDANHETADELWLGYHRKATGRPSVDWSQAVDEALCVGWIDGVRRSVDETHVRPAVHAAPQGQHLERDQRGQGRGADRGRADAAGRDRGVRGRAPDANTADLLLRAGGSRLHARGGGAVPGGRRGVGRLGGPRRPPTGGP